MGTVSLTSAFKLLPVGAVTGSSLAASASSLTATPAHYLRQTIVIATQRHMLSR